jgi:hydrogenase expression/formation protein HypC
MCLAVPVKVKSIQGEEAEVEAGGTTYTASTVLTPGVRVGDYVLLHTGYTISIVDPEEAEQTLSLLKELEEMEKHAG